MTAQTLTMKSTISYATRRARPLATLPLLETQRRAHRAKPQVRTSLTVAAKGSMFRLTLGPASKNCALRLA
jgi:hypothetical protein